jgi:hypothetical protein
LVWILSSAPTSQTSPVYILLLTSHTYNTADKIIIDQPIKINVDE